MLLIAHEWHLRTDEAGARIGLEYELKREASGTLAERLRGAIVGVLEAAAALEEDTAEDNPVRFATREMVFRFTDRLAVPATEAAFEEVTPELENVLAGFYGGVPVEFERVGHPRGPDDAPHEGGRRWGVDSRRAREWSSLGGRVVVSTLCHERDSRGARGWRRLGGQSGAPEAGGCPAGAAAWRSLRVCVLEGHAELRGGSPELAGTGAPVVVPIMASDGYYARRRLPQEWAKGDPSRSFVIAPPIGTLPSFPCILATKVGEAVTDMTRRGLNPVVLLVGHGTTRVRSSGDAARWVRDELALSFPHTEILTAFLDESPYLSEVAGSLGGRPVVAAPLLLGGGPHVLVDLAGALRAPRTSSGLGHLTETLKILPPILEWPELASLTLKWSMRRRGFPLRPAQALRLGGRARGGPGAAHRRSVLPPTQTRAGKAGAGTLTRV